jgi:hypothetical protein
MTALETMAAFVADGIRGQVPAATRAVARLHVIDTVGAWVAGAKRAIGARTVDDAKPVRRATSRLETPANVKRRTSRTTRIATLSAGINPLLSQSQRNGPYTRPAEVSCIHATPGGIIPEWWARINRNRRAASSRNRWVACSGISK